MSAQVVSSELQKRLSPGASAKAVQSNREDGAHPTCPVVSSEVDPRQSVDKGIDASRSNLEDTSLSKVPQGVSEIVHQKHVLETQGDASEFSGVSILPRKDSDTNCYGTVSDVKDKAISLISGKDSDSSQQVQSRNMEVFVSQSDQDRVIYSIRPEKALDKLQPRRNPDSGVQALPSDQGTTPSRAPEKPRRNPDSGVQALASDQGTTPSRAPEKPSEDGYNWRKYGQKFVRGNEFIRSYYKCTYPKCLAKKQVERSHDGYITDIHYIGKHEHPKPLNSPQVTPAFVVPLQMRQPDMPIVTTSEGEDEKPTMLGGACEPIKQSETLLPQTPVSAGGGGKDTNLQAHKLGDEVDQNGSPDLKRLKKDVARVDGTPPMKSQSEPRHAVQIMSEVDIVNDGYRWRKYGQKFVKGNPNPRSYYRCSSAGCPVKKHVERASHDPKLVVTTYEGQHDHDMPLSRTVTPNSTGTDANTTSVSGDSTSE